MRCVEFISLGRTKDGQLREEYVMIISVQADGDADLLLQLCKKTPKSGVSGGSLKVAAAQSHQKSRKREANRSCLESPRGVVPGCHISFSHQPPRQESHVPATWQ